MTRPPPASNFAAFVWLSLTVSGPVAAAPKPDVTKVEPAVEHVMFDRKKLPADMPRMRPGDAAFTQFNFNCEVSVSYRVTSQSEVKDGWEVNTEIGKIGVKISLSNKIYLPNGASAALRAHEEGHREINERVYVNAEVAAREEAEKAAGRRWGGRGRDVDAAGKNATDAAVAAVCKAYLARTADYASRVGDLYDEITDHGRNQSVSVADAIKQAFARTENPAAAK